MLTALCVAAAASALGAPNAPWDRQNPLATPRPYPANIVDSTARPGFNGRVWVGREIVGGQPTVWRADWCSPGPARYGAHEYNHATAYVRVNTLAIPISPWCSFTRGGDSVFERGRTQWLRERNYVGGVRTFVHPSRIEHTHAPYAHHWAEGSHRRHVEPRATIRMSHPVTRRTPVRVGIDGVRCEPFAGEPIRISRPQPLCESRSGLTVRLTLGH